MLPGISVAYPQPAAISISDLEGPGGFGYAVRCGLENFNGDRVAIMMADLSDTPEDLVRFHRKMDSKGHAGSV